MFRIDDILAECDDDDEVDESGDEDSKRNTKTKAKSSNKIYLTEDADSIIDFASTAANKNIMSK